MISESIQCNDFVCFFLREKNSSWSSETEVMFLPKLYQSFGLSESIAVIPLLEEALTNGKNKYGHPLWTCQDLWDTPCKRVRTYKAPLKGPYSQNENRWQ